MLLFAAVQLLLFKLLSFMVGDEHSLDVRRDGGLCTDDVPYGGCLRKRKTLPLVIWLNQSRIMVIN